MIKKKTLGLSFLIILLLCTSIFYYLKSNALAQELLSMEEKNEMAILEANTSLESITYQLAMAKGFLGELINGVNSLYETNNFPIYDAADDESLRLLENLYALLKQDETLSNEYIFQIGPIQKESEYVYFVECYSFENLDVEATYKKIETDMVPTNFQKGHVIKMTYENGQLTYEIMQ